MPNLSGRILVLLTKKILPAAGMLAAVFGPVIPASAQPLGQSPAEAITGHWLIVDRMSGRLVDGQTVPLQDWAAAENQRIKDALIQKWVATDPRTRCLPDGVPDVMTAPYLITFLPSQDMIAMLHEYNNQTRLIYMNAQHPADLKPSWFGHSVGHWEGDTLVIDTIGLNDLGPLLTQQLGGGERDRIPRTERTHVVERYRITPHQRWGRAMIVQITIEDPNVFTRPFTLEYTYAEAPKMRPMESICTENNRISDY